MVEKPRGTQSPPGQNTHQPSGQTLSEQLFGLVAGKAFAWFLAIVVLTAVTAQEWVRYFYPATAPPVAVTLLTLAVAVVGVLKMRRALREDARARPGGESGRVD